MKRMWSFIGFSLGMVGVYGAYRKYQDATQKVKPAWPEIRYGGKLTKEMADSLPKPAIQWLEKIGAVGSEQVMGIHMKQKGWMKMEPEQEEWAQVEAEQYCFVEPPSFYWKARMKWAGLSITGTDSFRNGRAGMDIRFLGLIPVNRAVSNSKLKESALQRYMMEMAWYPSLLFSPYIRFVKSSERSIEAEMTYKGVTASVTYDFTERGRLKYVRAMRYKDTDDEAVRLPCIAEMHEWKEIDGIEIPWRADITWVIDGRPFTWYKFTVESAELNPRIPAVW